MHLNRRTLLVGASALTAASTAHAQPAATAPASQPSQVSPPGVQQRLIDRARQNIHAIAFDGRTFSGPGWDLLVRESSAADFVLFGEEHGTHEAPLRAKELFLALGPVGFETLGIEISPPIAEDLDHAARNGLAGIVQFCRQHPPGPAFYFWQSEAELIAAVRAAAPGRR